MRLQNVQQSRTPPNGREVGGAEEQEGRIWVAGREIREALAIAIHL